MPASSDHLPENVAEVASIHISVAMGEGGTGCSYELDGLAPEAAIGYLTTVSDQIREEVKRIWYYANAPTEDAEDGDMSVECPNCEHEFDPFDHDDEPDDDEDDDE